MVTIRKETIHMATYEGLYKLLKQLFDDKNVSNIHVDEEADENYSVSYNVTEQPKKKPPIITPDYYQKVSRRTQNEELSRQDRCNHALFGLCSEVGEIHSIFQHVYQGKPVSKEKIIDECGDLCWFLCELLDTFHVDFSEVLQYNIDKLKARYPEGFSAERSEKRHEGEK